MPGPMPPQGGQPLQAQAPQQGQAPQGPQSTAHQGGATQVVSQVSEGLQTLKKMMDISGQAMRPEDKQNLGNVINAFQIFIEGISKPQGAQASQGPSQPMPANAAPGSKPSNF